jgi:hypothetical protein
MSDSQYVLHSTNAAHAGEIAQLSPVGHDDKATQLILDKKGNGLIHPGQQRDLRPWRHLPGRSEEPSGPWSGCSDLDV